jgi:hypothetical protein
MGIKDDILIAGSMLLHEKGVTALTQPQIAQAANIKQAIQLAIFPHARICCLLLLNSRFPP